MQPQKAVNLYYFDKKLNLYELLSVCCQYHIETISVKTSLFSLFIIKLSQDSKIFSFNIFFALKLSENVTSQIQNKHTITATKEPQFSQPLPQPPLSKWRRFLIRDTRRARRWFDSDETVSIVIYLHTPVPNPVMEKRSGHCNKSQRRHKQARPMELVVTHNNPEQRRINHIFPSFVFTTMLRC